MAGALDPSLFCCAAHRRPETEVPFKEKMRARLTLSTSPAPGAPEAESPRDRENRVRRRIRAFIDRAWSETCAELGCACATRYPDGKCEHHSSWRGASGKVERALYITQWEEWFQACDGSLSDATG